MVKHMVSTGWHCHHASWLGSDVLRFHTSIKGDHVEQENKITHEENKYIENKILTALLFRINIYFVESLVDICTHSGVYR